MRPQQGPDDELSLSDSTMRCKRNLWVAVEQDAVTELEDGTEFSARPFTVFEPGVASLIASPVA